jgi:Secretion system C-terminal sorting domain
MCISTFTGNLAGNQIELNWKVADEINIAHYELEHSTNGSNFTPLAKINNGKTNYSYIDKNFSFQSDINFYRLKIVAADGKFTYSNILPIKSQGIHSFVLSPNPAKNFVTISGTDKPGIMTILDANGKNVLTISIGVLSTKINISNLPGGVYIVRFTNGQNVSYKKLVIPNL